MLDEVLGNMELGLQQREKLLKQAEIFGLDIYLEQLLALKNSTDLKDEFEDVHVISTEINSNLKNPFGVIILAGGQGSRLGSKDPKGCFELDENESLFAILSKKLVGTVGHLAIMTSLQTDEKTRLFFRENQFFGLEDGRVDFFIQPSWPVLTHDKKWAVDMNGDLILAPRGNGCVFQAFYKSPIFKKWQQLGVHAVNLLPIDNFLADPKDQQLIGHIENGAEIAVRAIEKIGDEKMGMMVLKNKRLAVREYSELKNHQFTYGYSGLFAMNLSFLEKAAQVHLPDHLAFKKGKILQNGMPSELEIIKFEQFVFDAFYLADRFVVLNSCRKKYFCPLKDKLGPHGIESVKEKYLEWKRQTSIPCR